jgi:hypothetical protein
MSHPVHNPLFLTWGAKEKAFSIERMRYTCAAEADLSLTP